MLSICQNFLFARRTKGKLFWLFFSFALVLNGSAAEQTMPNLNSSLGNLEAARSLTVVIAPADTTYLRALRRKDLEKVGCTMTTSDPEKIAQAARQIQSSGIQMVESVLGRPFELRGLIVFGFAENKVFLEFEETTEAEVKTEGRIFSSNLESRITANGAIVSDFRTFMVSLEHAGDNPALCKY